VTDDDSRYFEQIMNTLRQQLPDVSEEQLRSMAQGRLLQRQHARMVMGGGRGGALPKPRLVEPEAEAEASAHAPLTRLPKPEVREVEAVSAPVPALRSAEEGSAGSSASPGSASPPSAASRHDTPDGSGPDPEPPPKAKVEAGTPILSANSPFDTAKEFAQRECMLDGVARVHYWQGQFWEFNGKFYSPLADEVMRSHVYKFLDNSLRRAGEQTIRFQPMPKHVNDVIDCLKTGMALGVECHPPMWLDTRRPATEWIVFGNKIVNVLTEEEMAHCPQFWAHSALGFDWNPEAKCPRWKQFLEEVSPGDEESHRFLEEFGGYCMTEETKFEKGAMLVGPRRSGKGTYRDVIMHLVGDEAGYVGLSFNDWAASENSKECLIGKRVGCFADTRFKEGRAFGPVSFDPGGLGHRSQELLLNIIGQDPLTIGRKYRQPWYGKLRLKLMIMSNRVLNFNDPTGAVTGRFIKVIFPGQGRCGFKRNAKG
jgi:putative DNA primase/helicase